MERSDVIKILGSLMVFEDVISCMVVKKGLEGIVPPNVKIKNIDLWRLVHDTTDDLFDLIDKFYSYGLGRITLELGEYTLMVAPVSRTVSLIVLIPSLANIGLLDVEVENAKIKINELGKQDG